VVLKPVKNSIDPIGHFARQDLAYYFTKDQRQKHFLGPYVVIYR